MLVIFPITAIGMDISVHKCRHSGNLHFNLFQVNPANEYDNCCCKPEKELTKKIIKETSKKSEQSCCAKEVKQVQTKTIKKASKEVPSCCSKEKIKPAKRTVKTKIQTHSVVVAESTANPETTHNADCLNSRYKTASCCDINKVEFSLSSTPVTIITKDNYVGFELKVPASCSKIEIHDTNSSQSLYNIKDFPLKEPIDSIISFISYSSSQKDDTDYHS